MHVGLCNISLMPKFLIGGSVRYSLLWISDWMRARVQRFWQNLWKLLCFM
jgi:hypothetical protein